ncbi:Na-Ca exchanger/integrin-beta4 [Afipia carboxidovorans OM5]|nr:hypothetical protein [Afipia carboxidovorans]ACI92113.1 Na-Ca exchanger/integrin-beta4 [Afipia carboxidovorans OM5]
MFGEGGNDTLVFNTNSGNFQVDDFTDGSDKIDMRGTGVTLATAAQNITLSEYTEGGVLVEYGSSQIWLADIMPGHVTFASDFIFDSNQGSQQTNGSGVDQQLSQFVQDMSIYSTGSSGSEMVGSSQVGNDTNSLQNVLAPA